LRIKWRMKLAGCGAFVQSIEEDADAVPRRWRITILEAEDQQVASVVSFKK
jgi:hypothetical protein